MPYVITAKRTRTVENGMRLTNWSEPHPRRAVATLAEARDAAFYEVRKDDPKHDDPPEYAVAEQLARLLPEAGGTIGPLPDGTVIEVEYVSYGNL